MPINIGDQVAEYTLVSNDIHFLAVGDTVITPIGTTNDGILNDDQASAEIIVSGTVLAGNVGVRTNNLADGTDIMVTSTGVVVGQRFGIAANTGSDNISIANHGSVAGYEQDGVALFGSDGSITNTGSIYGTGNGVRFVIGGTGGSLDNSGTITGGNGVHVDRDGVTITNSGTIMAEGSSGVGITSGDNDLLVYNSGTIGSTGAFPSVAINSGNGVDGIFNSGTIIGNVNLGGQADAYIGSGDGVVMGVISLGDGDDTGQLGNAGGEFIMGGAGDDTIRGGTGSDAIYGDDDNDDIRGRAGADQLFGGAGNDILRAGRGDDVLDGGSGNDFMRGGGGEDVIQGGLGQDTMFGNGGADVFLFTSAAESTNAGAAWDRIMDFTQGEDLIDLSQFNARFIGTGAYAANGNIAEVRIFEDPNGDTRVFVDVNADGVSDMRFYLVNVLGITADDFIL